MHGENQATSYIPTASFPPELLAQNRNILGYEPNHILGVLLFYVNIRGVAEAFQ